MDPFYETVILGVDGVPAEELMRIENHDHFFNTTQHLYRKYMALVIHNSMRQPLREGTASPTYASTLLDPTGLRLIQNNASKIALQILLGLMLVLGGTAYITTPMRKVLLHNPCTIAGVMDCNGCPAVEWKKTITVIRDIRFRRLLD